MKLCFPKIHLLDDCYLECFRGASFANLAGNGSQGGFVIFLRDSSGSRCPICCQLVKSLSSETLAALECAISLEDISSELSRCGKIKIYSFVDNRSLVDALYSCKNAGD